MSLAQRLKKSSGEIESTSNYSKAKLFQETLFGEPEPIALEEICEIPDPKPLQDPRPDLGEDSKLWTRFLELAQECNPMLAGTLHGFRCIGTRLVKGKQGYILRPYIHPDIGWHSQQEYERLRDRWLMPYLKEIADLLKKL